MWKIIFICVLSLRFITAYAQEDGEEISRLLLSADSAKFASFDRTITLTDEAERLITNHGIARFPQALIQCYKTRILACRYFQRLALLREYATKNVELVNSLRAELGSSFAMEKTESKIVWAHYYYEINDYAKAIALFSESLAELKHLPQEPKLCGVESQVIGYIATIHNARGEFEAAINQFVASIPYEQCAAANRKSDFGTSVLLYRNIGRTYLNKGDLAKAKYFLTRAEQLLSPYLDQNPASAAAIEITLLEAEAFYYQLRHRNDSVLMVTKKELPLLVYSEPFRERVYYNLGKALENLKHYADAEKYYREELSLLNKLSDGKSIQKADAFRALGNIYEQQGKMDRALSYYQNAITNLIIDFSPQGLENPVLKNILSKRRLFAVLQSKYRAQCKQHTKEDSIAAWQTCQLSLALLDSTANEYSLDRDKVILQEQSIQAFEDGLRIAYDRYSQNKSEKHFEDCFALMERSKGKVLLENLRVVNQFGNINPALLEKERQTKSELLLTEQGIFKGELSQHPPADLPKLHERYADLKRDYANLIEDIKRNAPDYYNLRFDHHVIDLKKIQTELLKPGEALIEFFTGDSTLTTVAISSGKKYITQKKITADFIDQLSGFRKLLIDPEGNGKDLKLKSKEWYNLLLEGAIQNLGESLHSLVIVPDGVLGYIPFETLIGPDDQYLIEKYSIRYAVSATYLAEQERTRIRNASSFFAGFVSAEGVVMQSSTRDDVSAALTGAKKEVSSIAELVDHDATTFDPATKQDFLQEAEKFKVLHLAMHSMVNEQNPMLSVMAFARSHDSLENQLTAIEIYGLHFNADLAVLSACNTGFGELHRGEGIMSFARAFSYAGVPSAVISLWEIPDKATSKIMVSFYQHLMEGKTKSDALQLAKTEFVQAYPSMAHPFYWSGFVLSGSNEPLQFPVSNYWYWVSATVAVLIMVFLLRRKIAMYFRVSINSWK